MLDVLGKGLRSRGFDIFLTPTTQMLVDFFEWWFVNVMAVWNGSAGNVQPLVSEYGSYGPPGRTPKFSLS
jgi:hypothetical protein